MVAQLYEKTYWNALTKSVLMQRGIISCDAIRETTPLFDKQCYVEIQRICDYLKPYYRV